MIILDGAQFGTGNQLMQVESKKLDVNVKWLLIGQQGRIDPLNKSDFVHELFIAGIQRICCWMHCH
jgi:hypothetical protein